MQATELVQRVRIYLNERDIVEGQALYSILLDRLRQAGATGATVLRGVTGFGPSHRLSVERGVAERSAPMVVEWVDRAERIALVLPTFDDLLAHAMITVEDVRVYRATLRASGPFGERLLGAITERSVIVAHPGTLVGTVLGWLCEHPQPLLPVLNGNRQLTKTVATTALTALIGIPLHILAALTPEERTSVLAQYATTSLAEIADAAPRILAVDAPIPQAVSTLVEWGLEVLPVVDRNAEFVGLLGVEQVLRAALEGRRKPDGPVRDAEAPPPVRLLMQGAVPTIAATAPATEALARLLATPERFLVVVDEHHPIGLLDDAHVLRQLTGSARDTWLAALRASLAALLTVAGPIFPISAADLPLVSVPTIGTLAPRDEATHILLEDGLERLIVVEENGTLAGIIGRRGLLRALAQELTN